MPNRSTCFRIALLLGTPVLLSACAYTHGITPQEQSISDQVAVDQYMPATREMRDNIETQELFAQAAFWSHEYDLNPSDLEATIKLAAAVRKLGNPGRAIEITQTSRQIHPRDPYLLAEHAAGLIASQRSLDAMPVLDQALRIAPGYGRLWSLRGAALDQTENYEAARDSYGRALQITPNDPNVLTNLGLSYALSGDLRSAESWLQRAVAIPGSGSGARENLALVLQLQGRTEEADRQARLASQSQGDRKLPPAPVPALTPRGQPAQLSQGFSYAASPNPAQRSASPNSAPIQSRFAQPQSSQTGANLAGRPAHTPTTQPGGSVGSYESAPVRRDYNQPIATQQQNVLTSIRQSLQPGAVTPSPPSPVQTQYQAQQPAPGHFRAVAPQGAPGAQPYIVGRTSPYASQPQNQAPFPQVSQQGYAQTGYPQQSAPPAPRHDRARRRR